MATSGGSGATATSRWSFSSARARGRTALATAVGRLGHHLQPKILTAAVVMLAISNAKAKDRTRRRHRGESIIRPSIMLLRRAFGVFPCLLRLAAPAPAFLR